MNCERGDEPIETLDEFLNNDFFTGWEQPNYPVCAVMGAKKGNKLIKEMLIKLHFKIH